LTLHNSPTSRYDGLHRPKEDRVEVKMTMRGQTHSETLVLLLAVCCLVPLAALAAVLYLAAPVWLVAPAGLLALVLMARRLMALLDANHDTTNETGRTTKS
jgi:hypothetical protein